MGAQRARNFFRAFAFAGVVACSQANAGESVTTGPVSVPAFPAALDCTAADCPDTLHAAHDITFISRVSFPLGSALLTREAQHELLRMLVELESFSVIEQVEIVGHADPSGPENYNRWLSEMRAKRVQDYFAQSGVDPRMMTLHGAGSSEPLIGAIDPSEQRRIEVHITLHPFR